MTKYAAKSIVTMMCEVAEFIYTAAWMAVKGFCDCVKAVLQYVWLYKGSKQGPFFFVLDCNGIARWTRIIIEREGHALSMFRISKMKGGNEMFGKVLERVFKVFNILINIAFGFVGIIYSFAKLFENYSNEHDLFGIIIFVLGFVLVNLADGFIRNLIKKF